VHLLLYLLARLHVIGPVGVGVEVGNVVGVFDDAGVGVSVVHATS
jgi:hypothetical protein